MIDKSFEYVIESKLEDYPNLVKGTDLTITINFLNCTVSEASVNMPVFPDLEYEIGDVAFD